MNSKYVVVKNKRKFVSYFPWVRNWQECAEFSTLRNALEYAEKFDRIYIATDVKTVKNCIGECVIE